MGCGGGSSHFAIDMTAVSCGHGRTAGFWKPIVGKDGTSIEPAQRLFCSVCSRHFLSLNTYYAYFNGLGHHHLSNQSVLFFSAFHDSI